MKELMLRKLSRFMVIPILLGISCSQDEGVGGNSHVKGCLIERVYNEDFTLLLDEKPAKKVDVFLVFGDQKVVGRDIETSYSGHFNFEYLWPGKYEIFYYSADSANYGVQKDVVVPVELSKNETLDLGNIYLYSTLEWNKGTATIKGKVMVTNYKNSSVYPNMIPKDVTPAQDKEVFLVYGNSEAPNERIRTGYDGTFVFSNLIKGDYLIYVLSEDVSGGTANIPIKKFTTIAEDRQIVDLQTFSIEKL
jgi:hypothetical protein